jgi:hypothetical protein
MKHALTRKARKGIGPAQPSYATGGRARADRWDPVVIDAEHRRGTRQQFLAAGVVFGRGKPTVMFLSSRRT